MRTYFPCSDCNLLIGRIAVTMLSAFEDFLCLMGTCSPNQSNLTQVLWNLGRELRAATANTS